MTFNLDLLTPRSCGTVRSCVRTVPCWDLPLNAKESLNIWYRHVSNSAAIDVDQAPGGQSAWEEGVVVSLWYRDAWPTCISVTMCGKTVFFRNAMHFLASPRLEQLGVTYLLSCCRGSSPTDAQQTRELSLISLVSVLHCLPLCAHICRIRHFVTSVIVKEKCWPPSFPGAPYEVKLDIGQLVYALCDHDVMIRPEASVSRKWTLGTLACDRMHHLEADS